MDKNEVNEANEVKTDEREVETANNIVVFIGHGEVIVTTKKNEAETVHWYFTEWKRNIDDYERTETDNKAVDISYKANIRIHRTGL